MQRVLVIGCGGSGKSTVAGRLGRTLGLEVIHLDSAYWGPGWRETPKAEWEEAVRRLAGRNAWVMDGNYGGTMDLRLAAADTVVFLDLPRILCLWRVIKRRFRYAGRSRPDMAPGCPERLTFEFLGYVWRYPATRRPRILKRLAEHSSSKNVYVLRSAAEVRGFLAGLERYGLEGRDARVGARRPPPAFGRPSSG